MRICVLWIPVWGAICLGGLTWSAEPSVPKPGPPRALDTRLKLELVAEHPTIVTPTGIFVDALSRIWVIECNTHFAPKGYQGHPTDRVWTFRQQADGTYSRQLFTDGLVATMSVNVRQNGNVYLATRKEIFLMRDENGDGVADSKKRLFLLDTIADYPHNALAGFAFDAMNRMYFGCGENRGEKYRLIGPDGTELRGGGEGGSIFRCHMDGTKFERWSTGYWNPHASTIDAFGRMFTVDNDPDSRPPCRLIHVIPGGDSGYRYRNGRKGLHPFSSWNGELPGTVPMVAGTGEAPSGIIAYEQDQFPEDYRGKLLVTSWGDYRIDRFALQPAGSSFLSQMEPIVKGGDDFRPVGIASAPDGSVFFSDWVKKDYEVHGQGRVWRLSAKEPRKNPVIDITKINPKEGEERLENELRNARRGVRRAAATAMAQTPEGRAQLIKILQWTGDEPQMRVEALWGLLRRGTPEQRKKAIEIVLEVQSRDEVATAAIAESEDQNLISTQLLSALKVRDHDTAAEFIRTALSVWNPEENWRTDPVEVSEKFDPGRGIGRRLEDPFIFSTVLMQLKKCKDPNFFAALRPRLEKYEQGQLLLLLWMRDRNPQDVEAVKIWLKNPISLVRQMGVQWAAEERLDDLRGDVEQVLQHANTTPELFMAVLAAREMFDGKPATEIDKTPPSAFVIPLARNEANPLPVRKLALRLADPRAKEITPAVWQQFLAEKQPELRQETLLSLRYAKFPEKLGLLEPLIADEAQPAETRADAILAAANQLPELKESTPILGVIAATLKDKHSAVQREGWRAMRDWPSGVPFPASVGEVVQEWTRDSASPEREEVLQQIVQLKTRKPKMTADWPAVTVDRPTTLDDWKKAVASGGDPVTGRRVFSHPQGPGCYRCHTVDGRGGKIGPDLSTIGKASDRNKLIESMLEPSKNVSPQFVTWSFVLKSGQVQHGLIVQENVGKLQIGTSEGKTVTVESVDVEERVPQKTSVMPEKLQDLMTVQEFRDVLAYLESLK
ncbi:MAG: PVC-type heme-binding CxxCH protein [Planctomycetales bacterium]